MTMGEKRADIKVGFLCNNNCIFCIERRVEKRQDNTLQEIKREFDEARKNCSEILITGGEPLLRKDIIEIISYAKKAGFKKIVLRSNGRIFFYPNVCKNVIDAGVTDFIIFLADCNEKIHDNFTRASGSFRQSIGGVRNLLKEGARVTIGAIITKDNCERISIVMEFAKKLGVDSFILFFPDTGNLESREVLPSISSIKKCIKESVEYALSNGINIKFQDIPYCISQEYQEYIENNFDAKKSKTTRCANCGLIDKCGGLWKSYAEFFGYNKLNPINSVPEEVKIELTRDCNLDCDFCYNVKKENAKEMTKQDIFSILTQLKDTGVKKVRFTGGEPFLRKDLGEILRYAKKMNLEIILNTNATLLNGKNEKVLKDADTLLISLNDFNEKGKIRLIKRLANKKIRIWLSTVLIKRNIENLEGFYNLIKPLKIEQWFLLRPLPNTENSSPADFYDVKQLTEKILRLNSKYKLNVYIANSLPFCSYDARKIRKICVGGKYDSGHRKIVIDAYGNIKQDYCSKKILGNIGRNSILNCWNSDYMKQVRNLEFVSQQCKNCSYLNVCKGGLELLETKNGFEDNLMIKDFKVLLINPKFYGFNLPIEPLALEYIASLLRKCGFQAKILDLNIIQTDIGREVRYYQPRLVVISNFTIQAEEAYRIGKKIKSNFPDILIAYGGVHSSFVYGGMNSDAFPKEPFKEGNADFVVAGEGEKIYLELANALFSGRNPKGIDGLFLRENNKIKGNNRRNLIMNIDSLPFPARDLVYIHKYKNDIHVEPYANDTAVDMISSRGCPNNCNYCVSPRFYQHKMRIRSADNVLQEVEDVIENYGIKNIHFHDDCFLLNKDNVRKLCEGLIKKNLGIKWICLASLKELENSRDIMLLMAKAGCVGIEIGIESFDEAVLREMNKKQNLKAVEKINNSLKKNSIMPLYLMISFYSGETINTAKKNSEMLLKLIGTKSKIIDYMRSVHSPYSFGQFATPYPGTEFYEKAKKQGIILTDSWKDYNRQKLNFIPYSFLKDTPRKIKNFSKEKFKTYIKKFKDTLAFYLRDSELIGLSNYREYVEFLYELYSKCNSTRKVEELCQRRGDLKKTVLGIKFLAMFGLIDSKNQRK